MGRPYAEQKGESDEADAESSDGDSASEIVAPESGDMANQRVQMVPDKVSNEAAIRRRQPIRTCRAKKESLLTAQSAVRRLSESIAILSQSSGQSAHSEYVPTQSSRAQREVQRAKAKKKKKKRSRKRKNPKEEMGGTDSE